MCKKADTTNSGRIHFLLIAILHFAEIRHYYDGKTMFL